MSAVLRERLNTCCMRREMNCPTLTDPVATTTPRGLPARGPRSAHGTDEEGFDLLHSDERHVAHSRGSDMHAINLSLLIPGEPGNVPLHIKVVLI